MYVVNEGIVVHNEWYDFQAYPKSAYVLLGMLKALVQAESHTLHRVSTNVGKNGTIINHIMSLVAARRPAFASIIHTHAMDVIQRDYEGDVNDSNAFCEAFVLDDTEGDSDVLSLYDDNLWAVRKTMEEFIAR
eukprot:94243_1